jgi:TonB family protein
MRWLRAYGFPAFMTVIIHAALAWLLLVGWSGEHAFSEPIVKPSMIKATMIELPKKSADNHKAEKKATPAKKKSKPAPKKTPPKEKPAPKQTPTVKPASKPVEKKVEPKPQPKPEPVVTPPPKVLDIDFSDELAEEDAARQAESELDVVNSYIAKIIAVVESVWSRPPSARNGMEVMLLVNLIPTGEVVNVSVATSSGNTAFDTSAVNAVYRAERFEDLRGMKPALFEANFRRFYMKFKPEDLRL